MAFFYLLLSLVSTLFLSSSKALEELKDRECHGVKYNYSSIMCQCDASYCDTSYVTLPTRGQYITITSNRDGLRFFKEAGFIEPLSNDAKEERNFNNNNAALLLKVDRTHKYQQMLGFGAAFTDSAGYVTSKLSPQLQNTLMRSLYSESGLQYNMGRVPIGGTDFSLRAYTYDDFGGDDKELKHFSLQQEDYDYKIPYIKRAAQLSSEQLLLTSAVWSPPLFMKSVKTFHGATLILDEYFESYARYNLKFLEEYRKHGVEFWSITPGNEPIDGQLNSTQQLVTCGWLPVQMTKFVGEHFGPMLKSSQFNSTQLFIFDDSRNILLAFLLDMLANDDVWQYVDGVSLHTYVDEWVNGLKIDSLLETYPSLTIAITETCESGSSEAVRFGSWDLAEKYAGKAIETITHHASVFIDWNFALDMAGGPSYTSNNVDSPVLVDYHNNRFFKQPSYYAMGHFSKYVPRGSHRVRSEESSTSGVQSVSFLRPDGHLAIVINNVNNYTVLAKISEQESGEIPLSLSPKSITTVLL